MLIDALAHSLRKSGALEGFWSQLDAGEDAVMGVASSARPFLISARFAIDPRPTLVVVAGEDAADMYARNIASYVGEERVLRFRDRSDTPFGTKGSDPKEVAGRLKALHALQSESPTIVVAAARSLLRLLPSKDEHVFTPLKFTVGVDLSDSTEGPLSFEDVSAELIARGFENTSELDGPGTFAVHGGTIDVFPGDLVYPVRIDFFGDEVDEIRRIVPTTGQTISSLETVSLYAVREIILTPKSKARVRSKLKKPAESNPMIRELLEAFEEDPAFDRCDVLLPYLYDAPSSLADFLPASALTVAVEPRSLIDDATHAYDDLEARAHGSAIAVNGLYARPAALDFGANTRATYVSIMRVGSSADSELPVKRVDIAGNPDKLFGRLRSLIDAHFTVVFSAPDFRARKDIELAFVDVGLPLKEVLDVAGDVPDILKRGVVNVIDVDIPLGMIFPAAKLALISLSDTQGSTRVSRRKRVDITEITFPYKPGDYVVHAAHGVALFKELVRQDIDGVARDYLLLEYSQGDKLFVPVEQLDRVTRYVGPEGSSPRLTRLNTSDWSRALTKARKATRKLAFDLVDVYTRRAATQGYRYSADTPWQKEMEDAFPYQETPDQLAAIAEIKADMQSAKPMDRLVCGDVGFGKTEVALRAAFKATQDGKQVMVLCPTTILAQQHFSTFSERFDPFDVKVEVLSRFRTPTQQKTALAGFADGSVDVLVGTHRLLSRDVNPRDLGLVIIDEEQRFGVGHKEQMKNLRESIDVLTLSATPIPRTMQMSLSGVRDMSLILTPPDDRLPVKVHVGEWDPDVVSDALRREIGRGGQVYYVSNRVRSIEDAVERVHQAAGEARVGVAHGKMTKEQLESVMEDFVAGQLDVLVATTIIESGIDNPHTNTLIIEDAQRLGLAQMYQLKGRVGRSSTQAYAYFMFPEHISLTEEATARLTAIDEHQDLGSGMRVAMRDLEIRGAGSLMGAEQSGNMSAVGFDLFAQMLAQAVNDTREGRSAKDELPPALSDVTVNVPEHMYLPEEYIPDTDMRVMLYRRIASADTIDAVDELYTQTLESRPEMPQAAINLFEKARIKALAHEHGVELVSVVAGKLVIEPIRLSRRDLTRIRRHATARYTADKQKLSVPMKYIAQKDEESTLSVIFVYLSSLFEKDEETADAPESK